MEIQGLITPPISPLMNTTSLSRKHDISFHTPTHFAPVQLALVWSFILISLIGILGNSFSIFLLSNKRQGRHTRILSRAYRVYIIALAVADNGMLFFTGVLRYVVVDLMYDSTRSTGYYEIYLCRWHRLLMHASHNAAVWLLVVMAFDRFIAVCFPFKYREMKHDSAKAIRVTCCVFALSFLFATPFLAAGPVYITNHSTKISRENNKISDNFTFSRNNTVKIEKNYGNPKSFVTKSTQMNFATSLDNFDESRFVSSCSLTATVNEDVAYALNIGFHVFLAFLFPYFVLLLLNIVTLRCIHYPSREITANSRHVLSRKITVMMLVVCFTFIILWLPQTLILLTSSDAHSHNHGKNETVTSLAALSGLLNSALNFILYCMTVQRFRDAAWVNIRRICCCKIDERFPTSQGTFKSTLTTKASRDKKSKLNSNANSSRRLSTPTHYSKLKVIYNGSKPLNTSDQVTLLVINNHESGSDRSSSSKLT